MADIKTLLTHITRDEKFLGKDADIVAPKVIKVTKFNEESAQKFLEDMFEAENTNDEFIPIVIDSYGGEVYSLFAMIDAINASNKKIYTISIGKSMSCGALLFSCGSEGCRFISPMSTIMIHDVSSGMSGKVEELKMRAAQAEVLNDTAYDMLDKNCGQVPGYFKKLVHDNGHADLYLNAQDCLKHNIANHIRIPNIKVNIKVNTTIT